MNYSVVSNISNTDDDAYDGICILDLDGTICDSLPFFVEAVNWLSRVFRFRPLSIAELRQRPARDCLADRGLVGARLLVLVLLTRMLLRRRLTRMQPCVGMGTTLQYLRKRVRRIGIVSSNSERTIRGFLAMHRLPEPDYVGTGSNAFGKPRLLKELLAASDTSAANAIYVVDEVRDIEAARSVGVRCIAVTWGYNERRILEAASPDAIVDDPGEIVAAMDRLLTL